MRGIGRRWSEAKSLRAFGFEVLVVVVGVLIALGAQELVDDWSWRQKVADGERMLAAEAVEAAQYLAENIVMAPCIIAQVERLDAKLREPGPWPGVRSYETAAGTQVIRAPSRSIQDNAWQSLMNDGTVSHFRQDRMKYTADFYIGVRGINQLLAVADTERAQLVVLEAPGRIDARDRFAMRQALGRMMFEARLQALMAAQMLAHLDWLGRLPPRDVIEAPMANLPPHASISICRTEGLPLGDWQRALDEQAAYMKAIETPPPPPAAAG